jgi:hypothetical protein
MVGAVMLVSTSYPAHAQSITALTPVPECQTTIFAAGDIAKCDNDDPWWEEFFELVKLLPERRNRSQTPNLYLIFLQVNMERLLGSTGYVSSVIFGTMGKMDNVTGG